MSYEPLPPHLDPRGKHRGGGNGPRSSVARPIGRVLGALLSISLLVLAGYYWNTYRNINSKVPRVQVSVGQAPTGGTATGDIDGKDQNILLVGNDDRSNMTKAEIKTLHASESSGSLATDTMIIIHVPADGSKATLISVPRDSYVDIKGYGMGKVNGAYADAYYGNDLPDNATLTQRRSAGANLLISTLQNLTGLTINHYVQIDLLGFYRISNAIGGVPVNLCHAVDDSHAANVAAGLTGGSGLVLSKGKHVIKGVTALEFVRQRHFLPRGDLDRVRRQQYFLTAAFRKVASVGILFKLRSLGDAVEKSVYLDPTLDLTDLGRQLQNLSANNIVSKTIPTKDAYLDDGTSILQVTPSKVQAFIDKLINPAPVTPSSSSSASTPAGGSSTSGSASSSAPAPIDSKCIN